MAHKFIIKNGELIHAAVDFHKQITKDHTGIIGGGILKYEQSTHSIYLYGKSYDFGKVTAKDLMNVLVNGMFSIRFDTASVYFSEEEAFEEANKNGWIKLK